LKSRINAPPPGSPMCTSRRFTRAAVSEWRRVVPQCTRDESKKKVALVLGITYHYTTSTIVPVIRPTPYRTVSEPPGEVRLAVACAVHCRKAPMPAPTTVEDLWSLVWKSGLVEVEQLTAYSQNLQGPDAPDSPQELALRLIYDGLLTRFQAGQLL